MTKNIFSFSRVLRFPEKKKRRKECAWLCVCLLMRGCMREIVCSSFPFVSTAEKIVSFVFLSCVHISLSLSLSLSLSIHDGQGGTHSMDPPNCSLSRDFSTNCLSDLPFQEKKCCNVFLRNRNSQWFLFVFRMTTRKKIMTMLTTFCMKVLTLKHCRKNYAFTKKLTYFFWGEDIFLSDTHFSLIRVVAIKKRVIRGESSCWCCRSRSPLLLNESESECKFNEFQPQ